MTRALLTHCPLASPAMSKAGSALAAIALRRDQRLAPVSARRSCCTVCIPLVTVARTCTQIMRPSHLVSQRYPATLTCGGHDHQQWPLLSCCQMMTMPCSKRPLPKLASHTPNVMLYCKMHPPANTRAHRRRRLLGSRHGSPPARRTCAIEKHMCDCPVSHETFIAAAAATRK